jgi:hypothetical protein
MNKTLSENHLTITFDKSVAKWMLHMVGKDIEKKCCYCGKKVTARNIGGMFSGKMMCKNIACLIEYTHEKESE